MVSDGVNGTTDADPHHGRSKSNINTVVHIESTKSDMPSMNCLPIIDGTIDEEVQHYKSKIKNMKETVYRYDFKDDAVSKRVRVRIRNAQEIADQAAFNAPMRVPLPSSLKSSLHNNDLLKWVRKRLTDEHEDLSTRNRQQKHSYGLKEIASGRYGLGPQAYSQNRVDTASRRRNLQRLSKQVRLDNLSNMLRAQQEQCAKYFSQRAQNNVLSSPFNTL